MSKGPTARGAHRSSSRGIDANAERCPSAQELSIGCREPTLLTAATYPNDLNAEQRRAVELA